MENPKKVGMIPTKPETFDRALKLKKTLKVKWDKLIYDLVDEYINRRPNLKEDITSG